MATTFTANCTYNSYNAFNPQGYGISNAQWYGWGSKYGSQYGYVGLRSSGSLRYAFVYKFTTPSWSGNFQSITMQCKLTEELASINRTIYASLTTTDPTTSTTLYTNSTLPSDSGRLEAWSVTVAAGQTSTLTLTFNTTALQKNKVYYLVLSPQPLISGYTSNYITIADNSFSAYITYEADASAVSASDGNIGSSLRINMTNDGMSHKLTYSFGGTTGTITNGTTNSYYDWTPPLSLCSQIPSATSGQCTIYCQTSAGTTSCTITLYVPDTVKPSITSSSKTAVNDNATVAAWGIYLQNYSKIRVQFQASASYSTIKSWRIDAGAVTFSADNLSSASVNVNELSAILVAAAQYSVSITVTDARGRTATASLGNYTVQAYAAPSATGVVVYRCLQDGTRDDQNGTYLYAKATRVYSNVGSNTCAMQFQYKERSAQSYTAVSLTDNTGVIVGNGQIDVLKSYNAQIYVYDSLTETYVAVVISSQTVAFNLKPSEDGGAAFGMYAQDDEIVELAASWALKVNDITKILFQNVTLKAVLLQLVYPVGSYFFTSASYANSAAVNAALGLDSNDAYWQSVSGQFTNCWHRIS